MSDIERNKKDALAFLREAYQNLKDARVCCDAFLDGPHYNDVTEVMQEVDKMISTLKTQKFAADFNKVVEKKFAEPYREPRNPSGLGVERSQM
jgi:hypothetical protein